MNIADVKADIKNKKIRPYYIFSGDELEIQRIYINKIAETVGYQVVRADTIAEIWPNIITPTLFDDPCVYVVRDDKDVVQSEVLQRQLDKGNFNGNIIVNLLSTVDKRSKWYKANVEKIVVFERLTDALLLKYLQRDTTLNKRNCERLIAICENDYSRILLEIDKIKRYNAENQDAAFEEMVKTGAIYVPPSDAIFDFVDAVLKRQSARVYDLLAQCYAIGEANMVILSVLFTTVKQTLQVQACDSSDITKSTGLTAWQVKCAKERCGYYSDDELIGILKLIQKTQKGISHYSL